CGVAIAGARDAPSGRAHESDHRRSARALQARIEHAEPRSTRRRRRLVDVAAERGDAIGAGNEAHRREARHRRVVARFGVGAAFHRLEPTLECREVHAREWRDRATLVGGFGWCPHFRARYWSWDSRRAYSAPHRALLSSG